MITGLSTACFYPMPTEKALEKVGELGFKTSEIFFNSPCELNTDFLKELKAIKDYYNIDIETVHPLASFIESYMFFSEYERRFYDSLEIYKKYFEAANQLGAKAVVMHGAKSTVNTNFDMYCERFSKLINAGESYGVTVAHENVVKSVGESPSALQKMRDTIGYSFKIVFDIKQSLRSGYDPLEFAQSLGDIMVQIHISDHNSTRDCIPPGEGVFDFKGLCDIMSGHGYSGNYIIELYRSNFKNDNQLTGAYEYLKNI
ncbi:MAG: sugar phosphate isomerase/epimerase [Oscillospiraceae bacterium]|jgi:sugar phosphate isomerase/epimerase|nr:sugar phosphate isomerase/epimerase [Oscillospiraceae bacterium]